MKLFTFLLAVSLSAQTKAVQLASGQNVQLNAPAVIWSVNPPVGTVSASGLYQAPATNASQQTVLVTASAGGQTVLSQTITLLPDVILITMPIEVGGVDGASVTVPFVIPAAANLAGPLTLALRTHNLKYETEASVQINNGAWTPLNTSTLTLLGLTAAYGGIGGGFNTFRSTMALPGSVAPGLNTVSFRFNGTDGFASEYRVLEFNILNAGAPILPAGTFVQDDPSKWTPPLNNAADISAGKVLFQTQQLSSSHMASLLKAHCSDCHTQDGRDIKYFNYDNKSIVDRAVFHGLTVQQGNQIASYIRSLTTPAPSQAHPWNPPYQPGPGLDSQPVTSWAAGAGIDAVLDSDAALFSTLFPNGVSPSFFLSTNNTNVRETPLPLQFPDWNTWLPQVHPMDAWPDFMASTFYTTYVSLQKSFSSSMNVPALYAQHGMGSFSGWTGQYETFTVSKYNVPVANFTPAYVTQVYSTALWFMVKIWELNQQFGLEGLAKSVFLNPRAESRSWLTNQPFLTSPNLTHIPRLASTGLRNGLPKTWSYVSQTWYTLQLVLNDGQYQDSGAYPIDWGYVYGTVNSLSNFDSQPQVGLFTYWLAKGLQLSNNGSGPNVNWGWLVTDISRLTSPTFRALWANTTSATRAALYQGFVTEWLGEVQSFTPAQFYADYQGSVSAAQVPNHFAPDSVLFVDRVWAMIPRFKYYGVNQTQINQMIAWATTIWPNGGWATLSASTCGHNPLPGDQTVVVCSSDK